MAGPDDGGAGGAEGRCCCHGALDVPGADVAEYPAEQQHVSRQHVSELARPARVSLADLDLRQPCPGGAAPRRRGVALVGFDQDCGHVAAARMIGQHADDVTTLASAETDQPDRPGRGRLQCLPQVRTDPFQSRGER